MKKVTYVSGEEHVFKKDSCSSGLIRRFMEKINNDGVLLHEKNFIKEGTNVYELFVNNSLSGLLALSLLDLADSNQDDSVVNDVIYIEFTAICLLASLRGRGLGREFCENTARHVCIWLIELIEKKRSQKVITTNISVIFQCDFENENGEACFDIFTGYIMEPVNQLLNAMNKVGVTVEFEIDAGY